MFQFLRPLSQNLYITYGISAGRAALYPYNAGQGIYFHCDYIHNDACLWNVWSSGFQHIFKTKQSPLTTQYHREQTFWHLFLSHYMCWLGPHNNIIIMIRIWYLVRENDDHDEEGDCGSACLVLANKTCSRIGLHFTFSSRLHTGPSLNITYH